MKSENTDKTINETIANFFFIINSLNILFITAFAIYPMSFNDRYGKPAYALIRYSRFIIVVRKSQQRFRGYRTVLERIAR